MRYIDFEQNVLHEACSFLSPTSLLGMSNLNIPNFSLCKMSKLFLYGILFDEPVSQWSMNQQYKEKLKAN